MYSAIIIDTGTDIVALDILQRKLAHATTVKSKDVLSVVNDYLPKSPTEWCWFVTDQADHADFDFNFEVPWHQQDHTHLWPWKAGKSHKQRTGSTWLINKNVFFKHNVTNIFRTPDINTAHDWVVRTPTSGILLYKDGEYHLHDLRYTSFDEPYLDDLNESARFVGNDIIDILPKLRKRFGFKDFWVTHQLSDYKSWDFDWVPEWDQETHVHEFPFHSQKTSGSTMYIGEKADLDDPFFTLQNEVVYFDWSWPMFNRWNNETIEEAIDRGFNSCDSEYFFIAPTTDRVSSTRLYWHPDRDQEDHLHVWSRDENRRGDYILVNRKAWLRKGVEKVKDYHPITWHQQDVYEPALPVVLMDMGSDFKNPKSFKVANKVPYLNSHKDSIYRSIKNYADNKHMCWIISNCCDYTGFDFSWRPDWGEEDHLHVWSSGKQKFGDTFLVPIDLYKQWYEHANDPLDNYPKIKWHGNGPERQLFSLMCHKGDLNERLENHMFRNIYEWFAPGGVQAISLVNQVTPKLWEKRPLISFGSKGDVSLVPRDIKQVISGRVKDYNNIQYMPAVKTLPHPQDIVFISYGEKNADITWNNLKQSYPHARRIDRVKGIAQATRTAAKASDTPWFYAVFAKTNVDKDFKFDFRPSMLEKPSNYIFHAYNKITEQTYGHGAIVMYHRDTVLKMNKPGFDFTTSMPCITVPLLSCTIDPKDEWEAWRTSFREVLKLKIMDTVDSEYLIHCWRTKGEGPLGEASKRGAEQALNYNGDIMLANDWVWLRQLFDHN